MALKIKTYEEIVAKLLTTIGTNSGGRLTNFNVGSVTRTLSEGFSEVISELYAFGAEMFKQGFLATSTGFWLDRKAKEFGLTRKAAITTQGNVVFSRSVARASNIPIPARTIVATKKDRLGREYRFFTVSAAVLQAGQTSVVVPVVAEASGKSYNVEPGTITTMRTFVAGVDTVTNLLDWLLVAGADAESDAALRARCFLAWEELSQGGTAAAYLSWAMSVLGVKSAWIDDNLPRGEGTVDVYVVDENGPPAADGALIRAVQALVNRKRPIAIDALVRPPISVTLSPTLELTPQAGFDVSAIEEAARSRVRIKFGEETDTTGEDIKVLGVGKDVVMAQLVHLLMGIPGMYSAKVARITVARPGIATKTLEPAIDIAIDPNEYPVLGTLNVTMLTESYE